MEQPIIRQDKASGLWVVYIYSYVVSKWIPVGEFRTKVEAERGLEGWR